MSFANPLRAIPIFQLASALRQIQPPMQHPAPTPLPRPIGRACHVPTACELAQTALANTQAGLREAAWCRDRLVGAETLGRVEACLLS